MLDRSFGSACRSGETAMGSRVRSLSRLCESGPTDLGAPHAAVASVETFDLRGFSPPWLQAKPSRSQVHMRFLSSHYLRAHAPSCDCRPPRTRHVARLGGTSR